MTTPEAATTWIHTSELQDAQAALLRMCEPRGPTWWDEQWDARAAHQRRLLVDSDGVACALLRQAPSVSGADGDQALRSLSCCSQLVGQAGPVRCD